MTSNNLYAVHILRDVFTDSGVSNQNQNLETMSLKSINEMIDKFNEDYGSPKNHFMGYKNKGLAWDYIGASETGIIMIAVFDSKNEILSADQLVSTNI